MSLIRKIRRFFTPGWEVWRSTSAEDDFGQDVKSWGDDPIATIDGAMREFRGDNPFIADKHSFSGTHRFYCAATGEIEEGDQIRKGGRAYDVKSADDVMQQGGLMQVGVEWLE
jgi:head-tail adaptor